MPAPELVLVHQARLADLLPVAPGARLEASGVLAHDGAYYVVFDNTRDVGMLPADHAAPAGNRLIGLQPRARGTRNVRGYEDIARDPLAGTLLLLVEAGRHQGAWMASIEEFDERFGLVSNGWLDAPLPSSNKGLEGLTWVQRGGEGFLLGLCEGNWCARGRRGRTPGGGRIPVFARGERRWPRVATVELPASLPFRDYSGLAAAADRLAVLSQESSALWVGRLRPGSWQVADDGQVYRFPRDRNGRSGYGAVEGVSWIGDDRVVVVSDRAKPAQHRARSSATQESIHVFDLPGAG